MEKPASQYEAYRRKMPEPGTTVVDEQQGEEYDVRK
jgi:hypothetical protein